MKKIDHEWAHTVICETHPVFFFKLGAVKEKDFELKLEKALISDDGTTIPQLHVGNLQVGWI